MMTIILVALWGIVAAFAVAAPNGRYASPSVDKLIADAQQLELQLQSSIRIP